MTDVRCIFACTADSRWVARFVHRTSRRHAAAQLGRRLGWQTPDGSTHVAREVIAPASPRPVRSSSSLARWWRVRAVSAAGLRFARAGGAPNAKRRARMRARDACTGTPQRPQRRCDWCAAARPHPASRELAAWPHPAPRGAPTRANQCALGRCCRNWSHAAAPAQLRPHRACCGASDGADAARRAVAARLGQRRAVPLSGRSFGHARSGPAAAAPVARDARGVCATALTRTLAGSSLPATASLCHAPRGWNC